MDKRCAATVVLVLLGAMTGCGSGDGSEGRPNLPTPTRSLSVDASRTPDATDAPSTSDLPDATPTTPTPSVTETEPTTPPPTRSRSPRPTPTATATATTTATATVTVEPTPTPTPTPTTESTSPTAEPEAQPAAQPEAESDSGVPAWVWWLLVAAALAAAAVTPLLVRRRRDVRWRDDLAGAEQDLAWFARTLVPALRHDLAAWTPAASVRVAASEDRLTILAGSGRHDVDQARALALRDAARYGREQVDAVVAGSGAARERLDGVQERLEATLSERQQG
jgi:hypothetical protein